MKNDPLSETFDACFKELPVFVPTWVKNSILRRIKKGKVVIVSAVCPDYARQDGKFTYRGVGSGVPYVASAHLDIVRAIMPLFESVEVEYHISLADTEFDLPDVVKNMTNGDAEEFLRRCQMSCDCLFALAQQYGLPIRSSGRFTSLYPEWYELYRTALEHLNLEIQSNQSTRIDLDLCASSREPLYSAMAATYPVGRAYCKEMVIRQWAQYMTWGECAEKLYGSGLIMVNHSTPNLSRINDPFFRKGRERIPILQLKMTTMPG